VQSVAIAAAVVVLAAALAIVVQRRRPAPPTQARWRVPVQLDRDDFDHPDAPWLVAVFTSATCQSCAEAMDKARVLASDTVAVQEIEVSARRDLHQRYTIEAVPTIVVADTEGVVRASFVGPPPAAELWSAIHP
jgi:protein-disulfide isomerase